MFDSKELKEFSREYEKSEDFKIRKRFDDTLAFIAGKQCRYVQISDVRAPKGKKKGEVWFYGSGATKEQVRKAVRKVFGPRYVACFE